MMQRASLIEPAAAGTQAEAMPGSAAGAAAPRFPATAERPLRVVAHDGSARTGAWLKLPRGIAVAVLLAVPFWLALAVWLLR